MVDWLNVRHNQASLGEGEAGYHWLDPLKDKEIPLQKKASLIGRFV